MTLLFVRRVGEALATARGSVKHPIWSKYVTLASMLRRTVLQWLATLPVFRAWAQTATFPGKHRTTLRELAVAVLPSDLGASGVDRVVEEFEQWVRDSPSRADRGHRYRFPPTPPKPPSPPPND